MLCTPHLMGQVLTELFLRFLIAGHETVNIATAWTLLALAQHTSVQSKLRTELLAVPTATPSMDELNALPYLEEDHPGVRQAAAMTCCRLFVKDPICYQASNHSIEIVSDVIDKLLTVAIADPGMIVCSGPLS